MSTKTLPLIAAALLLTALPHAPANAAWKLCVAKVCGFKSVCAGGRNVGTAYGGAVIGQRVCHRVRACENTLVDCPS